MASFLTSFALLALSVFFEHWLQKFPSYVAVQRLAKRFGVLRIFDCSVTGELLANFLANFGDFSILKPKIHLKSQVSKIKFLEPSEGGRLDFGS